MVGGCEVKGVRALSLPLRRWLWSSPATTSERWEADGKKERKRKTYGKSPTFFLETVIQNKPQGLFPEEERGMGTGVHLLALPWS